MAEDLALLLVEARARTLALVAGLAPAALLGPRLAIVNPPLWELGHVGWFQERWALRREGAPPRRPGADALYDSARVAHATRWDLPLPSLAETLDDLARTLDAVLARAAQGRPGDLPYLRLALLHEDMHSEALLYTRQTLAYAAPELPGAALDPGPGAGPLPGDVRVPGCVFTMGAREDEPWALDNERPPREVEVAPFAIARAAVTQAELLELVEAGVYGRRALWTDEGWRWRLATGAEHPVYWRRGRDGWEVRRFDRWVALEPHRPAIHVSCHEAEAFCRLAGRRLPTEAEWELAAAGPAGRRWAWGDEPPTAERAHLDLAALAPRDVGDLGAGDSADGCRQLIGNVWEWTESPFLPYPGFVPGDYREYSEPWFATHRVLRGGAYATRGRIARAAYRNFYTPDRRDVLAGFRTCAG
jgi:iron(II)-dependent oxidoreductase